MVQAENEGLRLAVRTEKRRRRRGRGIFEDMREEADGKALFFSPTKIQIARDKLEAKDREKDEATAAKEAENEAKRKAKEEQALMLEQRKAEREKTQKERARNKIEKQKERESWLKLIG